LTAMESFDPEGGYPCTRKMISWAFNSYLDEPKFEVNEGVILELSETKGVNPIINAQQLSDEQ
ncbi:hypothetical protein KI387_026578, partial [Taxus chinensis]